jgi:hypothetical protein
VVPYVGCVAAVAVSVPPLRGGCGQVAAVYPPLAAGRSAEVDRLRLGGGPGGDRAVHPVVALAADPASRSDLIKIK